MAVFQSEGELIRWLQTQTPRKARGVKLGIGDDAAVVRLSANAELILKSDVCAEDVHFATSIHPARSVGHRALARCLSDIAAVGGVARFALVTLALSQKTSQLWVKGFYAGLLSLGRRFGVALVGGETAVIPGGTVIDVMVAGEVRRGRALTRSGARPGDQLFVSGWLGFSALGLRILKSHSPSWGRDGRRAIQAHLRPEPRCGLGRFLAEGRLASALIDISDGLSTDLGHLCEASGVGARVWASRIPAPDIIATADRSGIDSLALALNGGEDYELLFTVPPRKVSRIPRRFLGIPLHCIGEIRRSKGMVLVEESGKTRRLTPGGYDHFRRGPLTP